MANGLTTDQMALEYFFIVIQTIIKVNGKILRNTGKVKIIFQMEMFSLDSISKAYQRALEHFYGLTMESMKVSFIKEWSTDRADIKLIRTIQIRNTMKGNSNMIDGAGKVSLSIRMETITRVPLKMTNIMVME